MTMTLGLVLIPWREGAYLLIIYGGTEVLCASAVMTSTYVT